MLAVLIAWAAYFFLGFEIITHKIKIADFSTSVVILVVAFFVLIFWSVRHLVKPTKAQQQAAAAAAARRAAQTPPPAPAPVDDSGSFTFRVAGVTFDNDDGESRQEILRHLKFGDAPWADDPDDLVGHIMETTFEGEQAFEVLVNDYQVGNVPKSHIKKVASAMQHIGTFSVSSVRIAGGGRGQDGTPLSYGCEITVDY